MKNPYHSINLDRRGFFKAALISSSALAVDMTSKSALADVTKPQRAPFDGLKLGIASYTFRKFSLDQAIAMSKEAGAGCISLKDFHLPYRSTRAEREEARKKVES